MPPTERIAIVTGTSSGIGRALADNLLHGGWAVIGVARRPSDIHHALYHHLRLDLADLDAMTTSFEHEVAPRLGEAGVRRIGLVNNAASIGRPATVDVVEPHELLATYAINVVAPTWLMAFVLRHAPRAAAVRIVNVSSGAAVRAIPGLIEYCGSKAALRMSGMVAAADLGTEPLAGRAPADVAMLSYSPGTVDTAMQAEVRSQPPDVFPSAGMFRAFHDQGQLAPADAPAREIAEFLDSARQARFAERRLGEKS